MFIFAFDTWVKIRHVFAIQGVVQWYESEEGETYYPSEVKAFCQH